jgi:hypothetical protein
VSILKQEDAMKSYMVQCWIRPRSGFDLARKSRILASFRQAAEGTLADAEAVGRAISMFERDHEGMVLEPVIIDIPRVGKDPGADLIKIARKKYPEAILSTWEQIEPSSMHVKWGFIVDEFDENKGFITGGADSDYECTLPAETKGDSGIVPPSDDSKDNL